MSRSPLISSTAIFLHSALSPQRLDYTDTKQSVYKVQTSLCFLIKPLKMLSLPSTSHTHFPHHRNPNFHIYNRKNPLIRSSSTLQDLDPSLPFPPIKSPKRVVLVRHGQSTWNEEGRIQGSSNFSVLTKKGETQADISRQMLVNDSFDACFASPLNRSKRTAEFIWGAREKEIVLEYELREIDLYSFQGLLKNEGKEKFGEAYGQWQKDPVNFNIDGHYPVRELWKRARNCWNKVLGHDGKSVLVVAHNAVNQALIATALGLGTEYFRILLQSNCGVSVLDFTPRVDVGSPHICLNRLNQTPNSPVSASVGGRKTSKQVILACHGPIQNSTELTFPCSTDGPMNMLGNIQSQKTAELLLDVKVNSIIFSPQNESVETAATISKVQEAADILGADLVPRYVEMKQLQNLELKSILHQSDQGATEMSQLLPGGLNDYDQEVILELWSQSGKAWKSIVEELSDESEQQKDVVVVVGHPAIHVALIARCLNLTKERIGSFHLDAGSISVIDFPDGPSGRGVIRCVNYTAHLGRWSSPVTRPTIGDEKL